MKGDKREETKVEKSTLSFDLDRKLEVLKKYGKLEERTNVIRILPSCHYSWYISLSSPRSLLITSSL